MSFIFLSSSCFAVFPRTTLFSSPCALYLALAWAANGVLAHLSQWRLPHCAGAESSVESYRAAIRSAICWPRWRHGSFCPCGVGGLCFGLARCRRFLLFIFGPKFPNRKLGNSIARQAPVRFCASPRESGNAFFTWSF